MIDGGGLIILETVVNMVHIAAAYQVVPPADLVHVDLGPGYGLGWDWDMPLSLQMKK